MIVKKCDRCGNVYEENTEKILEVTENDRIQLDIDDFKCVKGGKAQKMVVPVVQIGFSGGNGYYKSFDMCDECAGKILKYINNEADITV